MQLSDRIGRRIKLHDLHVLESVVRAGTMSKAAAALNTTQPAVSRAIAELERAIGVKLLDRGPRGVDLTDYGKALFEGAMSVFDDLKQAITNIETLAGGSGGELRIGAAAPVISGLLPTVLKTLRSTVPGMTIHVLQIVEAEQQYRQLREREVDVVLGRITPLVDSDIEVETLFDDRAVVVASLESKWARRRNVKLTDLWGEPWALQSPQTVMGSLIAQAFLAADLRYPPPRAVFGTIHLFFNLLASGPYLAVFPESMIKCGIQLPPIAVLPVKLAIPPWPVGLLTLKGRTISSAGKAFIEHARTAGLSLTKEFQRAQRGRGRSSRREDKMRAAP